MTLPIIPHPLALQIVRRLTPERFTHGHIDDLQLLEQYVQQCNQTSKDLQATLKAVMAVCGPEAFQEIKRRVEASRAPVPPPSLPN